jgi:hypothetical protein
MLARGLPCGDNDPDHKKDERVLRLFPAQG